MLITLAKLQLCNSIAFLMKTRSNIIHHVLFFSWVPGTSKHMVLCPAIFLSPIPFRSLIFALFLHSWDDTGGETPDCAVAPAWQTFPLVACWVGRGSGFGCWPGSGEEVPFSCLLELCLLPNVQGGGIAQGLKMCMGQLAWCARFTPQALAQLWAPCTVVWLFSEGMDSHGSCSDSSQIIPFTLLRHQENIALTGVKLPLLPSHPPPFLFWTLCAECIPSVPCLHCHKEHFQKTNVQSNTSRYFY